jgi:hypothetical protein|tara:strand:+ start:1526 stop:1720 length:195 start_codon:yes stop_codon:yes gene_type:complete
MTKAKPLKASTMLIVDLVKTNALLSKTIESQQSEISMLNFRIGGFLDYFKQKRKFTNKKYRGVN